MENTHKNIRFLFILFLLFSINFEGISQTGFALPNHVKKDKFSFKLINNLPVVPVELNGKKLTFLLDTGVKSSILFGITETDSIQLNNTSQVKVRGLGAGGSIPALLSKGNVMRIGRARDPNHKIYVIFDKEINFSTKMGIPIHGIIGHDFFKNFIVDINYSKTRITLYDRLNYQPKNCKRCEGFDLQFYQGKPYLDIEVMHLGIEKKVTLLVDSGSSDAIWLFKEDGYINEEEQNYFNDFLGRGLSGSIFGKRAKLDELNLGRYKLKDVNIAFPDVEAMENIEFFKERDGSIGGDFLKRFNIIIDYEGKKIVLKKNNRFGDLFHYNMSGLILEHEGFTIVKDARSTIGSADLPDDFQGGTGGVTRIAVSTIYDILLVPKFIVAEIRKGSPAETAGMMKGDEIIEIDGKPAHRYDLPELIGLFSSRVGKRIAVRYKRNGLIARTKFTLKKML